MKPMKLADVLARAGRTEAVTVEDARKIVGNQSRQITHNMACALSLHTWNNTAADWRRLEAALVILAHK